MREAFIYAITNTKTGKQYVGSTHSPTRRWHIHRSFLRSGKHHCKHLQHSWTKYGENHFAFEVIETLGVMSVKDRHTAECRWIALIGHYNTIKTDENGLFFQHGAENKANLSRKAKARFADPTFKAATVAHLDRYRAENKETFAAMAAEHGRSPASRKAKSEARKRLWSDPEQRPILLARLKAARDDPSARQAMSDSRKRLWENPETRPELLNKLRMARAKKTAMLIPDGQLTFLLE